MRVVVVSFGLEMVMVVLFNCLLVLINRVVLLWVVVIGFWFKIVMLLVLLVESLMLLMNVGLLLVFSSWVYINIMFFMFFWIGMLFLLICKVIWFGVDVVVILWVVIIWLLMSVFVCNVFVLKLVNLKVNGGCVRCELSVLVFGVCCVIRVLFRYSLICLVLENICIVGLELVC